MRAFANCEYVVAPSGSCAGMLAKHYPELFADEPDALREAVAFAAKCRELVSFLTDTLGLTKVDARYEGVATYHDSCSGLRELAVREQPRKLLATVEGLQLVELQDSDVCCGFGGTFAVKYGELSDAIVAKKSERIVASGADTLLAGDLGCLMNMAGKMQREGRQVRVRHVAEVLAGMTEDPPIGEAAAR
jgi:L-lactate dehydrogenase complex protein LldE